MECSHCWQHQGLPMCVQCYDTRKAHIRANERRATLLRVAEACDIEVEAAERNGYGQIADTYRMFAARLRSEANGVGT